MKKLSLLFLIMLAFGTFFQSCNNTKTYAERLEDERKATRKFVENHNIKTISQEEFEKDTITDLSQNIYALLDGGLYLQIINRGSGDTIKNRDEVILRMVEYNIMGEVDSSLKSDTIDVMTNINYSGADVDAFYYTPTASVIYYHEGYFPYIYYYNYQQSLDVPRGLIEIIPYIRDRAEVKVIVPSKKGHTFANNFSNVHPYFYHIHQIRKR